MTAATTTAPVELSRCDIYSNAAELEGGGVAIDGGALAQTGEGHVATFDNCNIFKNLRLERRMLNS